MALERLSLSVEMEGHKPCAKKQQNLVPGEGSGPNVCRSNLSGLLLRERRLIQVVQRQDGRFQGNGPTMTIYSFASRSSTFDSPGLPRRNASSALSPVLAKQVRFILGYFSTKRFLKSGCSHKLSGGPSSAFAFGRYKRFDRACLYLYALDQDCR